MKILYLDCNMGAAGDMLMAALAGLLPEKDRAGFISGLNGLGIPGVKVELLPDMKCGICGGHAHVTVGGVDECGHTDRREHHSHRTLADVNALIDGLDIPCGVQERAKSVYADIASAESRVHGREVGEVHFHEVGAMDAVTDIVGVCWIVELLSPERIVCSPLRTGYGQVKCAHGVLPVPAPATALLLEGVPAFAGDIEGEMTTPTGAALVRSMADEFGNMPLMSVERIGYGMGTRDFAAANCVRAMIGESCEAGAAHEVAELWCTIDDATAEELAFAQEELLAAGARDVFVLPAYMKKGRLGTLLSCLCDYSRREEFARLILKLTPTIGLRVYAPERVKLERSVETMDTPYGPVRVKRASGFGIEKSKPEYEDLARISRETGKSLAELRRELRL